MFNSEGRCNEENGQYSVSGILQYLVGVETEQFQQLLVVCKLQIVQQFPDLVYVLAECDLVIVEIGIELL